MQNAGLGQTNTNNLCCILMDDSWRLLARNVMNTFSANGTFYLLRDQMLICGGKAIDFSLLMTFRNSPLGTLVALACAVEYDPNMRRRFVDRTNKNKSQIRTISGHNPWSYQL